MDDPQKNNTTVSGQGAVQDPVSQSIPQQDIQTVSAVSQPLQPAQSSPQQMPISAPQKEQGPGIMPVESGSAQQSVEVQQPPSVESVPKPDAAPSVEITLTDKKAGVVPSIQSAPPASVAKNFTYPMTQQEAVQTVKIHKRVTDSIRWLAMLILRQMQKGGK